MSLGTKLYELRAKAGLSQDALAEKLDVSRQSVSKWETDASVPELEKLIKLAELYGVTLDELILDKKPTVPAPPPEPEPTEPASAPEPPAPPQPAGPEPRRKTGARTAGIILCVLGGIAVLFGLLWGLGLLTFAVL